MNFQSELSCVIASKRPKELANFYGSLLDSTVQQGFSGNDWFVLSNRGFKIHIYKPSRTEGEFRPGKRLSLCFECSSTYDPTQQINDWSNQIINMGAKILEEAKSEPYGTELWMEDPEGNEFLIFVSRSK